jgi:hypothetical protein
MGDGKLRHPHETIGKIRHQHRSGRWIYVGDGIFRHPHVVGLRHACSSVSASYQFAYAEQLGITFRCILSLR